MKRRRWFIRFGYFCTVLWVWAIITIHIAIITHGHDAWNGIALLWFTIAFVVSFFGAMILDDLTRDMDKNSEKVSKGALGGSR